VRSGSKLRVLRNLISSWAGNEKNFHWRGKRNVGKREVRGKVFIPKRSCSEKQRTRPAVEGVHRLVLQMKISKTTVTVMA